LVKILIGSLLGGLVDLSGKMLLRFNHFAAADARRAYSHAFGGSAHAGVYWTQIHVPAPLGDVMGVADSVS
jgi:hypothetical protein